MCWGGKYKEYNYFFIFDQALHNLYNFVSFDDIFFSFNVRLMIGVIMHNVVI